MSDGMMRRLVQGVTGFPARAFEAAARNPEQARKRTWDGLQGLLRQSPFWRARGVPARLEDAPLTDYEDYRAALDADFGGTRSSLNGEEILFWAKTSGTSAKPKHFPLTPSFRKQFQLTNPPFLHSLAARFPGFLTAPVLYFAATLPTERSPAGIEVGAISSFNYRKVPALLRRLYAFPLEVFADDATFFTWGPLYALATDLSAMISITPAMVVRFAEALQANRALYLPILEGRAQPPAPLPPVRVSPARRALLLRALAQTPVSFRALWPTLQFVTCWKSSTCSMQVPLLDPFLQGRVPTVDATYSATEGWLTVPLESGAVGGPLHCGSHIAEFLPAGQEPSAGALLPSWALTPGQDYEVYLTTAMGFVRYGLRDVVRCGGYWHRSPVLEFRQKAGALLSLGHTRVSEVDLLDGLAHAGFQPEGRWFFGPSATADRLVCYADRAVDGAEAALAQVDARISALNPEYEADLRTGLLQPMAVQVLGPTHAAWGAAVQAQTKPVLLRKSAP
jgi:hypothetical protein